MAECEVHELLVALARERACLKGREGPALLRALRAGVHAQLGFGSFHEYVGRLFGYSFRSIEDKLRVAAALERLPLLAQALGGGGVSWSVVRELARVATPETEFEWLRCTEGKTVREIEQWVAGRARGDLPSDPPRAELRRHVLRFDVGGETLASFREAMRLVRRAAGEALDDDAALLALARQVLQGPERESGARYQVVVRVCPGCGRGFQRATGDEVEIDGAAIEAACCDAEVQQGEVADIRCAAGAAPGQHLANQAPHGSADATHVGGVAAGVTASVAQRSIPAAVHRFVVRRDAGRCSVPGCRHSSYVDVHHIHFRSRGGDHLPDNLILLCGAHHRAVHRGRLRIRGAVSSGLHFEHSDGRAYGQAASAATRATSSLSDPIAEQVLRGLCKLGFRERDARPCVEQAYLATPRDGLGAQGLLRAALQLLTTSTRPAT